MKPKTTSRQLTPNDFEKRWKLLAELSESTNLIETRLMFIFSHIFSQYGGTLSYWYMADDGSLYDEPTDDKYMDIRSVVFDPAQPKIIPWAIINGELINLMDQIPWSWVVADDKTIIDEVSKAKLAYDKRQVKPQKRKTSKNDS